jgi:hypothetical protein
MLPSIYASLLEGSLLFRFPDLNFVSIFHPPMPAVGRDSVVGIVTAYGLHGPEIECRWQGDFPHLSRPHLGLTQPPLGLFPGGKAAGPWR